MDEKEQIYSCEVRRLFKVGDTKQLRWVERPVEEVILAKDTEYRCKGCHGKVKLNRGPNPSAHAVHRSKQDSAYCELGIYFRNAKDGRTVRKSLLPVT